MKIPVSLVILTYNEEKNIGECLESVKDLFEEIFIVDSYSTDKTLEIAGRYNSKIFQNKFKTHSKQWIWALNKLPIVNDWVMGLDSDQSITISLGNELLDLFSKGKLEKISGCYIRRKYVFMDQWIKHGGYNAIYLLKLFNKHFVEVGSEETVDHHFCVNGKTLKLSNELIECNKNEYRLSFWIDKHNRYSSLQSIEDICLGLKKRGRIFGDRNERVLWIKNEIWNNLPLFIRPLLYFLYRYFFRLGFLDGKEGLIFHFLQGFWYRFLVDAKIYEIEKKAERENKAVKEVIKEMYGIEV